MGKVSEEQAGVPSLWQACGIPLGLNYCGAGFLCRPEAEVGTDTPSEGEPSTMAPVKRGGGWSLDPRKTQGASPKPGVVGHWGLPICHAALVFTELVQVLLFIPNYLLRPGWLTCLFCACQTGGDGSFIKNRTPFKFSFLFAHHLFLQTFRD